MKYYMYNEEQEDEIVHYLAEQEELQQRDLGHLTGLEIDERDMEILKDVLEAHYESLMDILKDCVVDEGTQFQYKDELVRIDRMLGFINK